MPNTVFNANDAFTYSTCADDTPHIIYDKFTYTGRPGANNSCIEKALTDLFDNVGNHLETLIQHYLNNEFDELKKKLSLTKYIALGKRLARAAYTASPGFTHLHDLIKQTLQILYNATNMRISSLYEIRMLKAEIERLKCSTTTTPAVTDMSHIAQVEIVAMVRPEVRIYIQRWGLPPGGTFDPVKLADIVTELQQSPSPRPWTCGRTQFICS